jgi:hypothetical protein
MRSRIRILGIAAAALLLALAIPTSVHAQGRGNGRGRGGPPSAEPAPSAGPSVSVTLSVGDQAIIREYYAAHPREGVESLPPGIRRNLARGKPLPPGIAKRMPPADLSARIRVPEQFEIVEVGVDVFLVEVATGIIHDALMDIVR